MIPLGEALARQVESECFDLELLDQELRVWFDIPPDPEPVSLVKP